MKDKENKNSINKTKRIDIDDASKNFKNIMTDPDGSWTGTPVDENEKPIQDVDDL